MEKVRPRKTSTNLAEFFALMMRQQGPQALKSGVDALHPPPLVRVGNLAPDSPLLVHVLSGFQQQGPAGTSSHHRRTLAADPDEGHRGRRGVD